MGLRSATASAMVQSGIASLGLAVETGFLQDWTTLRFETGPYFMFTASVELTRTEGAGLLVLETRTSGRRAGGAPVENSTRSTLDLANGGVLVETCKLSRTKCTRFRYRNGSYLVEVLPPADSFEEVASSHRARTSLTFHLPERPGGGPVDVRDFATLVYGLADQPLHDPGDNITLWLATSTGPREVQIQVTEERTYRRTCRDLDSRRYHTANAQELLLRIAPVDREPRREGFMGLIGPTSIWIDAETRAPVEVDGRLPNLPGHLELDLTGYSTA